MMTLTGPLAALAQSSKPVFLPYAICGETNLYPRYDAAHGRMVEIAAYADEVEAMARVQADFRP